MASDAASPQATQHAVLQAAVRELEAAGIDHARRNAEWLLAAVLDCSRAALYAYPERPMSAADRTRFQDMIARRTRHEPLQYIIGHEEFYGLRMQVTPDVLIPRPETEELVERVLGLIDGRPAPRVLDVGTGSGCIALAIQHERPDATVMACDVSAEALAVARRNAQAHGLDVDLREADLLSDAFAMQLPGTFDVVVSNPPYIPDDEAPTLSSEVRDHEPAQALFTGGDALRFYRALIAHAPALLAEEGWLALELHTDYAEAVGGLFNASMWSSVTIHEDLSGRPRMVLARYSRHER
jgi:release factor glutamine methyltransferase